MNGKACEVAREVVNEDMEHAGANGRVVIEHCPGLLTLYSDGTFERPTDLNLPARPDFSQGVASRDVAIHSSAGTWARIFLPQSVAEQQERKRSKVPVVLHFHGGGFCVGSPASAHVHSFCTRMAIKSSCVWVSVHYRLAPEHPLPAAYEDALTALLWLRSSETAASEPKDPWLAQFADLSTCFLAGESAGGTIVHFLAAEASGRDWSPLHIAGLLIIHPAFPQEEPEPEPDSSVSDLSKVRVHFYHKSSLPPGAPFGHPLMNPLHPGSSIKISDIALPPALLAVAEKDPLLPGDLAYYHALQNSGKNVQFFESHAVGHCFHMHPERAASEAEKLENTMIDFIEAHTILAGHLPPAYQRPAPAPVP